MNSGMNSVSGDEVPQLMLNSRDMLMGDTETHLEPLKYDGEHDLSKTEVRRQKGLKESSDGLFGELWSYDLKDDSEKEHIEPHICGNYKHECPRFEAAKLALMTARVHCPFCHLLNDGQCSHFEIYDGHPSLKVCNRCRKYGEHWGDECPNVVSRSPPPPLKICRTCHKSGEHWTSQCPNANMLQSDNSKHPGPELDSEGKASELPRLGTDAQLPSGLH
ncbi:putative transcription factor interactor and regulator CCHC(Zn) family [Rosa chinensis]|uniref:Putative transcription factor interactor and regulator CCHC(Zn) family n=1 Tax=Rosa chinensis TaxID=74649 RepID=A0A2P6QCX9_ROSCH|nr:putative transcription factor interactor and regulator CCHC(Zn) family [Rosa chinensis]